MPLFVASSAVLLLNFARIPSGVKAMPRTTGSDSALLSSGQAVGAALAATVGTGNIVGSVQAISMGGPGAIFWMWMAALIGMPVKAGEIFWGQRMGGATGYIRNTLGLIPARLYAIFALCNVLLLGNMTQMNAAASLLCAKGAFSSWEPLLLCSLLLTLLTAVLLHGGLGKLGSFCSWIVFFMAAVYVLGSAGVLFLNRTRIPGVFRLIVGCALQPRAIFGAGTGLAFRNACQWGLRRGSFSNEAGLGTAANIHAYAKEADPRRCMIMGLLEVGLDTLILCTLSAAAVLCSTVPIPYGTLPGAELMRSAFSVSYGKLCASVLMSFCMLFFAMSTVLGSYVSGLRCAKALGMGIVPFRRLFLLCGFLGALLPLRLVWTCSDAINLLMAFPNLTALLIITRSSRSFLTDNSPGFPEI